MRPDDKPCDFQCRDGHFCVTTDNICDGIADCIDGSDELEAMCQVSVAKTTPLPISSNTQSPLFAAQQSTNDPSSNEVPNTDESYTTFLKNLVSEIFAKTNSTLEPSPQKMRKTTTEVSKDKSTHKTREIKELICDFVAKNCQRTDVLFSALRQDCPESCPSSLLFSWKSENSPSLLNGVSEEQLTRLRRYLEEIVNDSELDSSDAMPGCLDKDDCALVIFPAELDVSSVQFTTDEGLAFLEPAAVAPTQAQGTNNAHVPSIDVNTGNMRPRAPDSILEVPENDSELTSFENVSNDGQAVEVPILTPQKAEVRQEGGVMASDDNNQLAAYQQVSTWQEQQRQLDDNGHQVSDQQDKQSAMYNRENTRLLTVVDPNRSSSAPALSGNDLFAGAPNPEFHQESKKQRLVSIDNLQKGGYDKSASGIDAPKEDGTSETEARNSQAYGEVDMMLKMATKNEKLQNEILGSYLMSNSKRPRNAVSKQERFSGIFGQEDGTQAGDEISTTFLSASINTGSHDQTIIRSPTVKPISLKEWLILSGLIHELDYMDTSEVESALDHNRNRDDVIETALELAKDESEALQLVKNQQSASVSEDRLSSIGFKQSASENKQPTRGSGIFPETTSTPEVLTSNHGKKNNFLTNDDIHLLNEAIREYASSPISTDSNSLELKTKEAYLKPLNELKAFLFTQNADTSAGDAGFQEIHQNNNAEIRSSSDIKNELIINQNNAPASEAPSFKEEISSISSKSSSSPSSDSESTGASKSQFEIELPVIEKTNETNEPIEKSQSSDLWHATESISSNIGKDEIKSNLPIEASNRGDVQDEELIEHGQSRDFLHLKETLSPEKKMTSTSVLKTKPDVISPEWEHPVSHKAPTAQQNRKSEITADELSGLSRSSSQSESPAGALAALELERENTQIVKISSSVTPARSKQKPEELKNHLINALPDAVSHVQQHSSPPVTGSSLQDHKTSESHLEESQIAEQKIDERGDDANSLPFEINSPPESATYSQLAAKQQFQNDAQSTSSSPSPSIVTTSTKTSNATNAENPKIPKSEPVENLTSAVKSGAYAEGSDIALLNDLRLPELLDALRTNGAYADFHKDPVKGQISSSAADESERQTLLSNASKIPSSATVLNPFSAPFLELQEQPGTSNSEIVASQFTTELDPLFSQQIVSAAENTGSKYETQSASNLLSLGATQAPNSATMMSTSVNFLPSEYDASSSQPNSKTNSGDRYKVDGTQTVGRLNKLSSNNNLEAIETNRLNEPSSGSSMIAELGQKGSQSEEPRSEQIVQSSSNLVNMNDDVQSAAKKTDEQRVILTSENVDQPSIVPTTKPLKISTTQENNLNQGPSAQDSFSGSQIEVAQAQERFIISKYEEMITEETKDGSVLEENRMNAQEKQADERLQSDQENHVNMIPKSDVLEQSDRSFTAPVPSAEQSKSNLIQAYTNSQSHQPAFQNDLSQQQSSVLQSSSESQPGSILNTSLSPSAADFLAVNSPIFTAEDVKFAAENSHNANLRPTAQNTVTVSSAASINPVAYQSGSSEDLTLQQNRQVNEAASPERIEGDNQLKLIQMNENWMGSSNPQTYEAAPSRNTVPIQSELATVTAAEFENVQNLINNARENESPARFPNSKAEDLNGPNPIYAAPGRQSLNTDQVFSKQQQVSVNSNSEVPEINNDSSIKILSRENPAFADPNRLGLNSKVYIGSRLQDQPVVNQNVQLRNKDLPPELAFYLNPGASAVPESSPNSITRPTVSHRPEKPFFASEVEENVNGRMRPPLSASNVKIIPENYSQAGNSQPLVHNVKNEFNGDYNQAPQKKVPFQIFNDNLGSSYSTSNPSSSTTTDQSTVGKVDSSNMSSRDFFGAKVPGGSQSSQVTSALFCQSLGICLNEKDSETSGRQVGMRPSSGIGQCAPQCSVVGGKTICSYRKGL